MLLLLKKKKKKPAENAIMHSHQALTFLTEASELPPILNICFHLGSVSQLISQAAKSIVLFKGYISSS